jgi:N-methylhydantoinase B
MTVKGDELTFDFHGSDPQVTFVNSPLGNTISICMESFYAFIDPMAPKNQGSFRPVHVIAPEGTVVNPRYPATVGAGQICVGEPIMEACKIALAQALPERATGGFARHACPINVGMDLDEIDPRTGSVKQYMAETFASDGRLAGGGPGIVLGELRAARHRALRVRGPVPRDPLRVHDGRGGRRRVPGWTGHLRGDGVGRETWAPLLSDDRQL